VRWVSSQPPSTDVSVASGTKFSIFQVMMDIKENRNFYVFPHKFLSHVDNFRGNLSRKITPRCVNSLDPRIYQRFRPKEYTKNIQEIDRILFVCFIIIRDIIVRREI